MNDKLIAPISKFKARVNGGSTFELFNSEQKMARLIKFVAENFYDHIPELRNIKIKDDAEVWEVFQAIDYDKLCNTLNKLTGSIGQFMHPDSENGKPYFRFSSISQESYNVLYLMHMSYMPILKAHCRPGYNLMIECFRVLSSKGVTVGDSSITEFADDDYIAETVIETINNIEENEKEEYELNAFKYYTRGDCDEKIYNSIANVKPSLARLERYIHELPNDVQIYFPILKWAIKVRRLFNAYPLSHYREHSLDDFYTRNSISMDDEGREGYERAVDYEDVVGIIWHHQDIVGNIACDWMAEQAGNYGQIEYFAKDDVYCWNDFKKLAKADPERHGMLQHLPDIMCDGRELSEEIENYFNEKFKDKWTKQMKEGQWLPVDTC